MKRVLLYCNWGFYREETGIYISSVHAQYIKALRNIGYGKVLLISKESPEKRSDMDHFLGDKDIEFQSLPWFDNYLSAVKFFVHFLIAFLKVRKYKEAERLYIRNYEPFGWAAALVFRRKMPVHMHYISDPKSAIFSNSNQTKLIKILRYLIFMPEFFVTSIAGFFCNLSSNGPVPKNNLPEVLSKKIKVVIESALLESDVEKSIERDNGKSVPLRILYVGYIRPSKGINVFIQAMAILHSRQVDFRAEIVGVGEYLSTAKDIVQGLGLSHLVDFVGYIPFSDKLFTKYKDSDVFVNTSPSETGPRVVLEAKVFGCYIVSTNVGYVQNIIESEEEGVITEVNSPSQVARAVERFSKKRSNTRKQSSFDHNVTAEGFFRSVFDET